MKNSQNTFMTTMAKKRLLKDVKDIIKKPLTEHGIYYVHDEGDILRGYALIIGPEGSWYENGAYFFRFVFPSNYPYHPPTLTYCTNDGRTRFHPNLYRNGKVCLSILNTWKGEQWTSCQSIKTILLTLVTLFHNKPLTCEPGLTEKHRDFNPYNRIIEYKNLQVAVQRMMIKSAIPSSFNVFYPFIKNNILKERKNIMKKLEKLCKSKINMSEQYVRTYNMRLTLDYDTLKKNIDLAIKKLVKN